MSRSWAILSFLLAGSALAYDQSPLSYSQQMAMNTDSRLCRCPIEGYVLNSQACGMPNTVSQRPAISPWLSVSQIASWMGLSCAAPGDDYQQQLASCDTVDARVTRIYKHPVNTMVTTAALLPDLFYHQWDFASDYQDSRGLPNAFGMCGIERRAGQRGLSLPEHVKGDFARATLFLFARYDATLPEEVTQMLYEFSRQDYVNQFELNQERARREFGREFNSYILEIPSSLEAQNKHYLRGLLNETFGGSR
jgi:hypothetical protein